MGTREVEKRKKVKIFEVSIPTNRSKVFSFKLR